MLRPFAAVLFALAVTVLAAGTAFGDLAPQDIPVVRVQGTYQEMGYQLGFQLAPAIMDLVRGYFFTLFDPAIYQSTVIPYFRARFVVPEEYAQEIAGMLAGMRDNGTSLYVPQIGRDLEEIDMQIANAVTDIAMSFGNAPPLLCSSVTAWGNATLGDPAVAGETIHVRNLDWHDTIAHILAQSTLIVARTPSDPAAQPWLAVTFPGIIGCLSGMNAAGVAVNLNMGNRGQTPTQNQLTPVMLAIRRGVEQFDVNGDGRSTLEDVGAALDGSRLAWTFLIHTAQPVSAASPADPAATFEVALTQRALRLPADDPDVAPWFHITTNHHRKLFAPANCWRYAAIKTAIREDFLAGRDEMWAYLAASQQTNTCQSMLFLPASRELWLSYTDAAGYSPAQTPAVFTWNDLFPNATPTPDLPATATPTALPSATPVPPTPTPVPPTDTPVPPTAAPVPPTAAPDPPTATAAPEGLSVALRTSQPIYRPGDQFQAVLTYVNGPQPATVLQAIVLDVWGQYWFAPGWTPDAEVESRTLPVTAGADQEFLSFTWPAGAGTFDGIKFWAAFLDPQTWGLLSNVADCAWGAAE